MEMKNCPYCGAEVKAEYPYMSYIESYDLWNFHHNCDPYVPGITCNINVYGKTEEEVIKRWNRRAGNE